MKTKGAKRHGATVWSDRVRVLPVSPWRGQSQSLDGPRPTIRRLAYDKWGRIEHSLNDVTSIEEVPGRRRIPEDALDLRQQLRWD